MDGASVNGGNAEAPREDLNLDGGGDAAESTEPQDPVGKTAAPIADDNVDAQEVNGDLKSPAKKPGALSPRRKSRKFKANSTGAREGDTEMLGTRGRKRKRSDADDGLSSEDSAEFNGFDSQGPNETQPGSHILKKLIGNMRGFLARLSHVSRCNYNYTATCTMGKES